MLKQIITGMSALLLLAAPFSSAQASVLAKIEADVDGSGQKKTVELTGDRKIPGSNYYSNLWILIRNPDGKMVTAWKSDLDGGYYCLLEKMPVQQKKEAETAGKDRELKKRKEDKNNKKYEEQVAHRWKNWKR